MRGEAREPKSKMRRDASSSGLSPMKPRHQSLGRGRRDLQLVYPFGQLARAPESIRGMAQRDHQAQENAIAYRSEHIDLLFLRNAINSSSKPCCRWRSPSFSRNCALPVFLPLRTRRRRRGLFLARYRSRAVYWLPPSDNSSCGSDRCRSARESSLRDRCPRRSGNEQRSPIPARCKRTCRSRYNRRTLIRMDRRQRWSRRGAATDTCSWTPLC